MSGVPMNMEEWQRRMKAEKEAERKKKMESAEILKGYRGAGLAEEERKLLAMRQEDRQKYLDAQQNLHEYRGTDDPAARKRPEKSARDQHPIPPGVERPPDVLDQIEPGSVSAKAAHLMASISPTLSQISPNSGNDGRFISANGIMGAVPAPPEPAELVAQPVTPTSSIDEKTFEMPRDTAVPSENMFSQETVPEHVSAPPDTMTPPPFESMMPPPPAPTTDLLPGTMMPPMPPPPPVPAEQVVRLDIHVSFGIITAAVNPDYVSYMTAVQQILKKTEIPGVSYKPECPPYVTNQQWDDNYFDPAGRPDVRRVLVTATVPVFLSSGYSSAQAKQIINAQLRSAISSGSFLELSR